MFFLDEPLREGFFLSVCLPLQRLWVGCNSCSSLPFHRFNNVEQGEREGTRREGKREREREWWRGRRERGPRCVMPKH